MIFNIPNTFLEAIKEQSNAHKVLWMDWLCGYADKILDDDFCENYKCPYDNLKEEKVREVYNFGVALLRDGFECNNEDFKFADKLICEKVISHLNLRTGATYDPKAKKNKELIMARFNEGYCVNDFISVIDKKCHHWLGTNQEKYLRPLTLFSASKFENYLNEPDKIIKDATKPINTIESIKSAIAKAKQFDYGMGRNE